MNVKELAEQSGMEWDTHIWCWLANPPHLEKFAELVRADERKACADLVFKPDWVSYRQGVADGAAQPEQEHKPWVGLTDDEIKKIMQRWRNGYIDIKDVEQLLKDKNI